MSASFPSANTESIILDKVGSSQYRKLSYPLPCGVFTELVCAEAVLHFNGNGEILRAKGRGNDWHHPNEWLRRTVGNDWVYYSSGGYTGVFEAIGEYYLPNFTYPTNSLLGGNPFADKAVHSLIHGWYEVVEQLAGKFSSLSPTHQAFFTRALANTPQQLATRAEQLHRLIGERVSVLPPDARHVDYQLIPLTLSRGCLHKCRFCKVKNGRSFTVLSLEEIRAQIIGLQQWYDHDLGNYNALFLGEHDALQAGEATILTALEEAYRGLRFAESRLEGHCTFLFGSAVSLLSAPESLLATLNALPGRYYINIGLESADRATLEQLGKPISVEIVRQAFQRLLEINKRYDNIEITANFIMEEGLPPGHLPSVLALIRDGLTHPLPKGSIYFSPLTFGRPSRARLFEFNRLKVLSRLPTFLYIIQRL
jgi:Radical SAM superfamily